MAFYKCTKLTLYDEQMIRTYSHIDKLSIIGKKVHVSNNFEICNRLKEYIECRSTSNNIYEMYKFYQELCYLSSYEGCFKNNVTDAIIVKIRIKWQKKFFSHMLGKTTWIVMVSMKPCNKLLKLMVPESKVKVWGWGKVCHQNENVEDKLNSRLWYSWNFIVILWMSWSMVQRFRTLGCDQYDHKVKLIYTEFSFVRSQSF